MSHITGPDRSRTLLLPESVDDYVGRENPVRFIYAFVDGLDLMTAGFARVVANWTGRPDYAPKDLLKLYIFGYLNRVRSSRRLEAETHRNIEVIRFKTIADFRSANRNAFRPIFRQFVLLCRQLDLYVRELLAVDGTRIKAVNNKDRNFTRASLTQFISLAAATLDAIGERRTRCKAMLAQLNRTGKDQISLTNPDSRAMATHTRVAVGYNVQIAVDVKHKLIVE
jgi:transposase